MFFLELSGAFFIEIFRHIDLNHEGATPHSWYSSFTNFIAGFLLSGFLHSYFRLFNSFSTLDFIFSTFPFSRRIESYDGLPKIQHFFLLVDRDGELYRMLLTFLIEMKGRLSGSSLCKRPILKNRLDTTWECDQAQKLIELFYFSLQGS